jgi:hypothetical protein
MDLAHWLSLRYGISHWKANRCTSGRSDGTRMVRFSGSCPTGPGTAPDRDRLGKDVSDSRSSQAPSCEGYALIATVRIHRDGGQPPYWSWMPRSFAQSSRSL